MKRVLAVLVAAALIIIAVVVRHAIDDDSSSTTTRAGSSGTVTIACASDLAPVCTALATVKGVKVVEEDAGTTLDAANEGKLDVDAWLTLSSWPEMANVAHPELFGASIPLASTKLALVIFQTREAALKSGPACGGTVDWVCLGNVSTKPWGEVGGQPEWGAVHVAYPPRTTAAGLLIAANAVHAFYGAQDPPVRDYGSNDFDRLHPWIDQLEADVGDDDPLDTMLTQAGRFAAVGATQADTVRATASHPDVSVLYPAPVGVAQVVLAPVTGAAGAKKVASVAKDNKLTSAIRLAGYTIPADKPSGVSADPGVLVELEKL